MITIQNDTIDILARDLTPYIMKVAQSMINELTPAQRANAEIMMGKLNRWHGEFEEHSIGATVYAAW